MGLIGLRRHYPAVRWQDGVRYVDDGDVITAAGVLSGVDAALRVVERMVGSVAAWKATQAVDWPDYSPGIAAPIPRLRLAPADTVGLLSAAYRWDRPNTGVLLTEGVGEIELASAFRPYTERSYLARPVAVTADGQPIRSRHGLTFVPRADLNDAAPELDRLVIPGADAAQRATPASPGAADSGLFAYSARFPLRSGATRHCEHARRRDRALGGQNTAVSEHESAASGPAWPWALTLRPVLLAAAAAVTAAMIIQIMNRRRRSAVRAAETKPFSG